MKAINRLYQYFESKQIKPTNFEKSAGLSNGYLSAVHKRSADIGSSILKTIADNCRDLDLVWLITGQGDMIVGKSEIIQVNDPPGLYSVGPPLCERCKMKDELIESLRQQIKLQKKLIEKHEERPIKSGQKRKAAS